MFAPPLRLQHLIKTEPILREDKELQAEARGRRLGASSRLQIIQMLMASTIEAATMEKIAAARRQQPRPEGGALAGEGSSSIIAVDERGAKRGREDGDEEESKQATLLNSLKLIRHSGQTS